MGSKGSPIEVNEERAFEVFTALGLAWTQKKGVLKDIVLPQNRYPVPPGDKELANYLFFVAITMRGGIVSDDPVRWLYALWQKYPEVFEPEKVIKDWDEERLCEAFRTVTRQVLTSRPSTRIEGNYRIIILDLYDESFNVVLHLESIFREVMGLRYREFARSWLHNALILNQNWQNNALNIFAGVKEFEQAFARVDYRREKEFGLKGMRRKIFSLFTIWLQERLLIPNFPTPLPVDFHALRILQGTEVVKLIEMRPWQPNGKKEWMNYWRGIPAIRISERITDAIARWSQGFLFSNGFDHQVMNPMVWLISRILCAAHFQNGTRDRTRPHCTPEELSNNPGLWPQKYRDPCPHCPVKDFCRYVSPSGTYYRSGVFVRQERIPFPPLAQLEFDLGEDFAAEFVGRNRSAR